MRRIKKKTPHIQPQGGLSFPVQQSRKLPSDAVRVHPSVASLCLFSVGRGSPSGAADPRLPSVAVWRLRLSFRVALRAQWRTGLPLPVQQSRWLPSVVMGALLPTRQTAPCIKPQGGLSPPVQQSRKLPSDAVRVPPSVASLCLFSVGRGSPSGAADPRLPSVAVWRLRPSFRVALRARWRTGLPLPVQQSCWLPSVVMGALLPTRQTAPCRRTLPSGAAEPQLPSDAVRVPPSVASPCFFSIGRGSPSGAADPRLPSVAGWALRLSSELCCVLCGGRGSSKQCSRAAGSLRLHGSPPSDASNRASNFLAYSVSDGALPSSEAEPQLPSDAARVPHLISAIVLLF